MTKRFIHNNKGVTLMELLIVLALIAVLSGLAGLSLSLINSSSVDKASTMLNASIEKGRYAAMAKGGNDHGVVNISVSGGSYVDIDSIREEMLANSSVSVFWSDYLIESTSGMNSFSGTSIKYNSNGMIKEIFGGPANYSKVYQIAFKKGKKVSAVVIYPATGKSETKGWYE